VKDFKVKPQSAFQDTLRRQNAVKNRNDEIQAISGGALGGSEVKMHFGSGGTVFAWVEADQFVNVQHFKDAKKAGVGNNPAQDVVHETIEPYIGAQQSPGAEPGGTGKAFEKSHGETIKRMPGTVKLTQLTEQYDPTRKIWGIANPTTKKYIITGSYSPSFGYKDYTPG